jgi:hypothetical protein
MCVPCVVTWIKFIITGTLRTLNCDIFISREISREVLHVSFSTAAIITYLSGAVLTVRMGITFTDTSVAGVIVLSHKHSALGTETYYCLDDMDQNNLVRKPVHLYQHNYIVLRVPRFYVML